MITAEQILAEVSQLNPQMEITVESQLFDSGYMDSISIFEFLVPLLEEKFGITVSVMDLMPENFESVKAITKFVNDKLDSAL